MTASSIVKFKYWLNEIIIDCKWNVTHNFIKLVYIDVTQMNERYTLKLNTKLIKLINL